LEFCYAARLSQQQSKNSGQWPDFVPFHQSERARRDLEPSTLREAQARRLFTKIIGA
jgi:hypothetical protein